MVKEFVLTSLHKGVGEQVRLQHVLCRLRECNLLLADKATCVLYHNDRDIPLKRPPPNKVKSQVLFSVFPSSFECLHFSA